MIRQDTCGKLPDGRELVRTYSDEQRYIRGVSGDIAESAVDVAPAPVYTETNIPFCKGEIKMCLNNNGLDVAVESGEYTKIKTVQIY